MFDNIRGVITFEAAAAEPEAFLNILKQSVYPVSELRYKGGRIFGNIYRADFPGIQKLAENNGVLISVSAKRGGIFTLRKYRFRTGIAIGLALSLLLVFYLSNIVMAVEVYGNETLTDKQVISILKDNGIKIGAFLPNIDLRETERRIVSSVDDIAWIGIRSSGCIVQAEISEIDDPPEMISTRTPCNVVSSRDAQIVAINRVDMGMLIPMLYDGVKKGDILISGTVEDGKGGVYLSHAMGEIIGRYSEKVTFSQNYTDEKIKYTDKITRKSLSFFGLKIPLYVGRNDFGQYEYDENTTYFRILNIELPIGTVVSEYHLYETEEEFYTPEKAQKILEEKIKLYERNFFDGEDISIADREVYFSETSEGMTAIVKYTLESDIGMTQEILAKKEG